MKAFAILAALALTGCATHLSAPAQKIQAADEKMVENCQFLGMVNGTSAFGNLTAKTGMQNASNEALERAVGLGATHIVWVNITGAYSCSAVGRAYQCN